MPGSVLEPLFDEIKAAFDDLLPISEGTLRLAFVIQTLTQS